MMARIISTALLTVFLFFACQAVYIEYPKHRFIQERLRADLDRIDPILRHYLVPREIQYQSKIKQNELPYFLRCSGSQGSLEFSLPSTAAKYLIVEKEPQRNLITIKLREKQLNVELVGRYVCSETSRNKQEETAIHVFIQDDQTVFTRQNYSPVVKETGIHFFNVPCQSTTWYAKSSCSHQIQSNRCTLPFCVDQERRQNELKCNTIVCQDEDICIPVYLVPANFKAERILFDPQIGFALEMPSMGGKLREFICMSNYTPSQQSKVSLISAKPEHIHVHQQNLNVMPDETVELTCEIQYGAKVQGKLPNLFWFNNIHNLELLSNKTGQPIYNLQSQLFTRTTSITLRGFKSGTDYKFYCVRVSEQGIFTRSVTVSCVDASILQVDVTSNENEQGIHPLIDLVKNGVSLQNQKRLISREVKNQENQYYEYTLALNNLTFDDASNFEIVVKSSQLRKSQVVRPNIKGDPVGQSSFIDSSRLPGPVWRDEDMTTQSKIYFHGILYNETYTPVCTVRHLPGMDKSMQMNIQYYSCRIEKCLTTMIERTCTSTFNQNQPMAARKNLMTSSQTQWIGADSHSLTDSSIGYQYLCCLQSDRIITLSKSITVLSNSRQLFHVEKPYFGLVDRDTLQYRCGAHPMLYRELKVFYNDGSLTYERTRFDRQWRLKGTNQYRDLNVQGSSAENPFDRTELIEIKKPLVTRADNGHFIQCTALSKRPDIIPHAKNTYYIQIEEAASLKFKTKLDSDVLKMERKTGENIFLDCAYSGRPKPRIQWYKGKLLLKNEDATIKFGEENQNILIPRAQPIDTGYYTCELTNAPGSTIRRSFDLRIKGTNPYRSINAWIRLIIGISILIAVVLLAILILICIKYIRMKSTVKKSAFHEQEPSEPENQLEPAMSQLSRIQLPANFASSKQIVALLDYVNGKTTVTNREDFKELGRGQFGVVYQVRLPDVDLVAAKLLPENIRRPPRSKQTANVDGSRDALLEEHEIKRRRAVEMLIDEMKVMHKAGQHVNIIGLKKVAYPETRFRFLFTPGLIRDENSFYLMELCSNGSLESLLKKFLNFSNESTATTKQPLYDTLIKKQDTGLSVAEALEKCTLTEEDLKLMAYQVACGLDYLNRKQIVHCDIAARNVLVNKRFVLKICDFGLATWTSYSNYREQMTRNATVQIEKKTGDIATHNLTPELARAFLNSSDADERSLLKKSSIKADVWSFGIFLWTLFLKCRLRPFYQLLEEVQRSPGKNFFHCLAQVIADGHVLDYINYEPEIPRDVYAYICLCLVKDNSRPEMVRIRSFLCHQKSLSRRSFDYYRLEYNRFKEENATDGNIELFGDDQGVSYLPSFETSSKPTTDSNSNSNVKQDHDDYLAPMGPTYTNISDSSRPTTDRNSTSKAKENQDDYLAPTAPSYTNIGDSQPIPEKTNPVNDSYV